MTFKPITFTELREFVYDRFNYKWQHSWSKVPMYLKWEINITYDDYVDWTMQDEIQKVQESR